MKDRSFENTDNMYNTLLSNNNNNGTKADVINPKATGYLGGYDECSTTNLFLPGNSKCSVVFGTDLVSCISIN